MREDHVASVLEEARKRLGEITKNKAEYKQVLEKLILQALFQTMEQSVILRCRQADVDLIKEILPSVINYYKDIIGDDIEIAVDRDNHLSSNLCGGIEIIALNGRVKVNQEMKECFNNNIKGKEVGCICFRANFENFISLFFLLNILEDEPVYFNSTHECCISVFDTHHWVVGILFSHSLLFVSPMPGNRLERLGNTINFQQCCI